MERLVADHPRHRIGQLDLAARAFLLIFEHAHHLGLEDVAADHRQVRRRCPLGGLLDQPLDLGQRAIAHAGGDDAVHVRLVLGDFLRADQIATDLHIRIDHLLEAAWLAEHEIVGEQHRERLVADDVARAPHRMAEPHRLLLADISDRARRETRLIEHVQRLAARRHRRLELIGDVEMVLDRRLAAPGDEDHLLDPRFERFVDRILDQRTIDDRQHFLWHRLGRRQEARPKPAYGKNGLTQGFNRHRCLSNSKHLVRLIRRVRRQGKQRREVRCAALRARRALARQPVAASAGIARRRRNRAVRYRTPAPIQPGSARSPDRHSRGSA